ncbi:helix-turn-helix transcriptional regulator [Actinophytocola sp.]|uniref:helix-turn-helix transcriptional regulator n=1 Tax=Actinophytocola sp. TaxID=1872138 RepID=UPI003899EAD6
MGLEQVVHLRRARDHMDAHYADPLKVGDLAAVAGFSRYHFVREFRVAFGETPAAYLSRRRVERAMDLLAHANLTVTEVCMVVGFSSLGSFSRRFRELVGCSPSEYRSRTSPPVIPGCIVWAWARPRGATLDKQVPGDGA